MPSTSISVDINHYIWYTYVIKNSKERILAINIATSFNLVEDNGEEIPVIQTELVTLDFIHEYMEYLKESLVKIDDQTSYGRLNWEYMITKVLGEQISRYSKLRVVNDAKRFNGQLIYFINIKPIPELYCQFDAPILDTVSVSITDTYSEEIIFNGVLSSYERPEEYK